VGTELRRDSDLMQQGTIPNRSIVWSTLLAGCVLFLCGAHPILSPADRPATAHAARSAVRIRQAPAVVVARLDDYLRDSIVTLAREQIGTPYVLGGASPDGFDCSGFVRWVLAQTSTRLPRTARQQAQAGVPVTRSRLLPGDLLTFGSGATASHVGIYLGDGKFVHASSAAGRVVVSRIDRRVTGRVVPLRGARRVLVANGG
jgi:cell wall-associated NlpC family hydrolase